MKGFKYEILRDLFGSRMEDGGIVGEVEVVVNFADFKIVWEVVVF